jgi:peptidoglycan/xylan/chitin deacetylase (PgdA/CDA1 family)
MLRAIGKTCLAAAYTVTRMAQRRRDCEPGATPFIICYHRVVENFEHSARTAIPSMLISTAMLERHIDWLAKRFSIESLDEIGERLEAGRPFRRPTAAVTFDDGYSDVYHHAFPLLKRKGVQAAVFVVTNLMNTTRPQIFDRLYLTLRSLQSAGESLTRAVDRAARSVGIEIDPKWLGRSQDEPLGMMTVLLNRFPLETVELLLGRLVEDVSFTNRVLEEFVPLTWDMVEIMSRNDITIGSHTQSHTLLTTEKPDTVLKELRASKEILESKLKTEITHFAYPDGRFNRQVVKAVGRAGYRFGYGICRREDARFPLLTIPRKVLWERASINAWGSFSPSIMTCHSRGVFDSPHQCEHDHSHCPSTGKKWNDQLNTR